MCDASAGTDATGSISVLVGAGGVAVDHRYWTPQVHVSDLAKALHDAWEACVATAKEAFPSAAERAPPTCPAQWVELTADGELSQLGDVPDRLQRHISRCKNRLALMSRLPLIHLCIVL